MRDWGEECIENEEDNEGGIVSGGRGEKREGKWYNDNGGSAWMTGREGKIKKGEERKNGKERRDGRKRSEKGGGKENCGERKRVKQNANTKKKDRRERWCG